MYVFPGSFLELDLLRVCLINAIRGKGVLAGIRLAVITPRLAVPELWRMWQMYKEVADGLYVPTTQP